MIKIFALSAAAVLAGSALAFAQTSSGSSGTTSTTGEMKMTQAQCESLWNRADSSQTGSLTQAQAQAYVTDFKAANTSNSGRLTKSEFMTACGKGMVHNSQ